MKKFFIQRLQLIQQNMIIVTMNSRTNRVPPWSLNEDSKDVFFETLFFHSEVWNFFSLETDSNNIKGKFFSEIKKKTLQI